MSKENTQVLKQRREKADLLADLGVQLYTNGFKPANRVKELMPKGEHLAAETQDETNYTYSIAGRIMSMRKFGKAAFFHLADSSGRIQVYIKKDLLGDEVFATFKKWDIGDIVGIEGKLFRTKMGELSVLADKLVMISKSLRPLPEKFHGLTDTETRYRQRYVDLIMNEDSKKVFHTRSKIIRFIRDFMEAPGREFLEVETPMMHPIPGGATARPFVTHHNALDLEMYLRIAPELYLKRLIVGGLDRVYEINRSFRNEGVSTRHNPEFTMLEFYWAYANFEDLMDLTETMLRELAVVVSDGTTVVHEGQSIDFGARFERISVEDSVRKFNPELADADLWDAETLKTACAERDIHIDDSWGEGKVLIELFEATVESKLLDPTFITSYPTEVSPLSRRNDENPLITDRFELFISGREIANGFSELNDPEDQAARFQEQVSQKDAGDLEAMHFDADYIRALEYGMPPTAGEGIGIDRLVMLFTDSASIRDVLLFPHMRPES